MTMVLEGCQDRRGFSEYAATGDLSRFHGKIERGTYRRGRRSRQDRLALNTVDSERRLEVTRLEGCGCNRVKHATGMDGWKA